MAIDNLTVDITTTVGKEEEKSAREIIRKMVSNLATDVSTLRNEIPTRELVSIETMALNAVCNAYEKVLCNDPVEISRSFSKGNTR